MSILFIIIAVFLAVWVIQSLGVRDALFFVGLILLWAVIWPLAPFAFWYEAYEKKQKQLKNS